MEVIETNQQNSEKNPLKKWVILLGVLAGVFFATTIYFGFIGKPVMNTEYIEVEQQNACLQAELNDLLADHEKIKQEYGDLTSQLSEKDSIILANAAEIEKLINAQEDTKKIRKQLLRLQNIAKEYVDQIDQLYTENKLLKEENIKVKENLEQSQQQYAEAQESNKELTDKINSAAVHKAYNISCRGVYTKNNGEEVITEKASRVESLKTTFILSENTLIPAGPVNVYCRIAIPGTGRIIAPGAGDAFSFMHNGERLQYTVKQTVNFNGAAHTCSLVWDLKDKDKAIKGSYAVQVFTDDVMLGETILNLR